MSYWVPPKPCLLVVLDGLAHRRRCASTAVALEAGGGGPPGRPDSRKRRERAPTSVLIDLGLEPLLALRLRAGEGVGATLATQLLLAAATARLDVGRVDR